MEMPIITTKTTNVDIDIKKEGIGLYNIEKYFLDLEKMALFSNPNILETMSKNAHQYALAHSYENYCARLYTYIAGSYINR